jgi:hypothetical protein
MAQRRQRNKKTERSAAFPKVGEPSMSERVGTRKEVAAVAVKRGGETRPSLRPTAAQKRYLSLGLSPPGGKLPLFDRNGAGIDRKTVESCIAKGWAEPWFGNPMKRDWLVCKLTLAGYAVLGTSPPAGEDPA